MLGLTYYVNHYLPHGTGRPTGEIVERGNGGFAGWEYKEDLREVDIPNWAKFFRNDNQLLLVIGLVLAGIWFGSKYSRFSGKKN
jgi:hypothetical protein